MLPSPSREFLSRGKQNIRTRLSGSAACRAVAHLRRAKADENKCLFANARPAPDLKYCSSDAAVDLSLTATTASISHGRNLEVCGTEPELWTSKRAAGLRDVIPT